MSKDQIPITQVLKNLKFFLLWIAQAITSFGDSLSTIAFISLITWFTRGEKEINMMWLMLSFIIPQVIFGPLSGVLVDKWRKSRKRIMVLSDIIRGIFMFLIPFTKTTSQVFIIAFILSLFDCFFSPAASSLLPTIVKKEELVVANSLLSSVREFMEIVGVCIGGVFIAGLGIKPAFFIDAATFFLSGIIIRCIPVKEVGERERGGEITLFSGLKEGIVYIKQNFILFFICLIFFLMMIAGGTINLILPIFVNEVLRKGPKEFGFLMSANGLGIILGSLLAGRLGQNMDKLKILIFAIILCGINSVIFAINPIFIVGLALFVINGCANGSWEVSIQTIVQEKTEDENRGRVFSIIAAISGSTNILSTGMAGILAKILGSKILYLLSGMFMFIVGTVGSIVSMKRGMFKE